MIHRSKPAAIALALGMLAGPSSAQQVGIIQGWPPLSPWVTLLMGLPGGKAVCSTVTQTPPLGPAGYSVAFALGDGTTHFYLTLSDRTNVDAKTLQLVGEGGVFADMTVISQEGALGTTIANIPSDDFVKKIVPELLKAQTVMLRAGNRTFAVPHGNFAPVMGQIAECAGEYRKRFGAPR